MACRRQSNTDAIHTLSNLRRVWMGKGARGGQRYKNGNEFLTLKHIKG